MNQEKIRCDRHDPKVAPRRCRRCSRMDQWRRCPERPQHGAIEPSPRQGLALDAMNSLDGWPKEQDYE
jgi:hypothetical protein